VRQTQTPISAFSFLPAPVLEDLLVLWAIAMTGSTAAYLIMSQRDMSR